MRARRWLAAGILGGLALASCSSGPTSTEVNDEVINAESVLPEVEAAFAEQIAANLDGQTTTVDGGASCFLSTVSVEEPNGQIYCGPLRTLGNAEGAWFWAGSSAKLTREGIKMEWDASTGFMPVDGEVPSDLRGPSGQEPPPVDSLPEPQAPAYPETDFARLLPETSLDADISWEELPEPLVINTPAATFVINGSAALEQIPATLVGQEAGDRQPGATTSAPPIFVPAEGQTMTVWRVAIEEPVVSGPQDEGWSPPEGTRDASTRLTFPLDGQRIPVISPVEATPFNEGEPGEPFTVSCLDGIPCEPEPARYVLLTSLPDAGTPSLTFSTDGQDQTLDLSTGEVSSEVSSVADDRTGLVSRVSTTWPRREMTILTEEEAQEIDEYFSGEVTYAYAGRVENAYLSPFHKTLGWADAGRAWLVVPVRSNPNEVDGAYGNDRRSDIAQTYTFAVGDDELEAVDATEDNITFDVPVDLSTGEFRYQPTGTLEVRGSPVDYRADEPLTVTITFEE